MSISTRTRKLLWGRSGSRCAYCRRKLIEPSTPVDDESIVGDECHIVSSRSSGPRHDPQLAQEELNDYSNLLLLCKVHHKLIDDQASEYPASRLADIKASHEKWVSDQLDGASPHTQALRVRRNSNNMPAFLPQIRSGKELLEIVTDACELAPHYDDLSSGFEHDLVAGFLQNAEDLGELGLDSVSERMQAARYLDDGIEKLERAGFWIFGHREQQKLEGGHGPNTDWPVAHVRVLRNTNSEIIRPNDLSAHGES